MMGKAINSALEKNVLQNIQNFVSYSEIAKNNKISLCTINKIKNNKMI